MTIQPWFAEARYGLMIHFGSYSLTGWEASWPLQWGTISHRDYEALSEHFSPNSYDPGAWAKLAAQCGFKYVILTTKHHDGFALWDSGLSDYSAPRRAAGRDLVTPFVEACREAGLKVGLYFSLPDWHHPDYPAEIINPLPRRSRPASALPSGVPASIAAAPERWQRYVDFMHGQVRELCTFFGNVDLFWFDGQWEHSAEEWCSREPVSMVRKLQPDAVINDRLGEPGIGDYATPEQFIPVVPPAGAWETCMTVNESWAHRPGDLAFKPVAELIAILVDVVARGGNLVLGIGATANGEIVPEAMSRLRVVGEWLARNGEAIHGAGPGLPAGVCHCPSTGKGDSIYLHVLGRPAGDVVRVLALDRPVREVRLLASGAALAFSADRAHPRDALRNPPHISPLRIQLPPEWLDPYDTVIRIDLG